MSKIENYFTCNCCLFAQDLTVVFLEGASLGIPNEDKPLFIDCHFHLSIPVTEKMPEFNLRHRQSVGCGNWRCAKCGLPQLNVSHHGCWNVT